MCRIYFRGVPSTDEYQRVVSVSFMRIMTREMYNWECGKVLGLAKLFSHFVKCIGSITICITQTPMTC